MNIPDGLAQEAVSLGIALSHYDIDGNLIEAKAESVEYFVRLLRPSTNKGGAGGRDCFDGTLTAKAGRPFRYTPDQAVLAYTLADETGRIVAEGGPPSEGGIAFAPLPYGYYTLSLETATARLRIFLIAAPDTAYRPDFLQNRRAWGLNLQLYSLRSEHNWGIGDFGDLHRLIGKAAAAGADFIGLNPLHAAYPAAPEWASPYSASSRHWLNFIYLDVGALPEFSDPALQSWWQDENTQNQIRTLREAAEVDYSGVFRMKLTALKQAFTVFENGGSEEAACRRTSFDAFAEQQGAALQDQALFDALDAQAGHPHREQEAHIGWLGWPQAQVLSQGQRSTLLAAHAPSVRFYAWLQWLSAGQLALCRDRCVQTGMKLGLYGDLAVGSARGSADVWRDPELYLVRASAGAPPDPLGPAGQNWNLPPWNPHSLLRRGLQPFIRLLRANMPYFGLLRIDHVMGLFRLWCIPEGKTSADGVYLHYPLEAMMAVLAVESRRNRCTVVGEDLGTVPDEVRRLLERYRILSYNVLYFAHKDNAFPEAGEYPAEVFATVGTHDLPPLAGYWHCRDLQLFAASGMLDGAVLQPMYDRRLRHKQMLLDALRRDGFLPPDHQGGALDMAMHEALNRAVHRYLAATPSRLIGVQLENLAQAEQPFNLPGTDREYPNWRVKLPQSAEALLDHPNLAEIRQIRQ